MNADDIPGLVLWSDDALLVVNKPAGLATLPDGYNPDAPYLKGILVPVFGPLWIVHRLDRITSGVIVLARSAQAHRALNIQFDQRQVQKIYHALVIGRPDWQEKTIHLPLRPNGDRKHRTVVDARRGKPAATGFRILERFSGCSLVEAIPQTGRTHQIRAHLAAAGFPIAADALYGGGESLSLSPANPGDPVGDVSGLTILSRPALHAMALNFTHPLSSEKMSFEAPYPLDISQALGLLKEYSRA